MSNEPGLRNRVYPKKGDYTIFLSNEILMQLDLFYIICYSPLNPKYESIKKLAEEKNSIKRII